MRTLVGVTPYIFENQPVIEIMYRAWWFIFSVSILLPLRWLPDLITKPSRISLPVTATAALIVCGELVLGNPTISPSGPFCPGDNIQITFTGTNLPDGETIQVFMDDNSTYNPFMGGGMQIGTIPIEYNCTTCPTLLGLMANPCGSEVDNEFAVLSSGCGFDVDDLLFDLDINNNNFGAQNDDIGSGSCPFQDPDPSLISSLQTGNCANLIIPAGPGDNIPGGAIVIIFTDDGTSSVPNFDDLCLNGQPVYILQNSCTRTIGAISNNATPATPTRTYTINVGPCSDAISFGYDPAYMPDNSEFRLEDGTLIQSTGCDPPFNMISYPDIPNSLITLNYTIPAGICAASTGLIPYYISGMIDMLGPCEDMLYTPPAAASLSMSCLNMMVDWFPTNTSCDGDSSGSLVATILSIGGSPPYTTNWENFGEPGVENYLEDGYQFFGPGAGVSLNGIPAGTYSLIVTDNFGCTDTVSYTIVNNDPPVADIDVTPILCNGSLANIGVSNITPFPIYPYVLDWDNIVVMGNEDFDMDGIDTSDVGFFNVPPGTYVLTLTVSDGNFVCVFDTTIVITEPPLLTVSAPNVALPCFGNTTTITATTNNGGTPPYSFNWAHLGPPIDPPTTTVGAGSYPVIVTDANGCIARDTAYVTQPAAALAASAIGETLPCDDGTGNVDLTVTPGSGTSPYTFLWSNGPTTEDQMNLNAGTYTVTVTDANGCTTTAQASIIVDDQTDPIIMCPPTLDLGCNGVLPAAIPFPGTASDACGILSVTLLNETTTPSGCTLTTIRTYEVEDVNGNTATCQYTITRIVDVTGPVFSSPPGPITVECIGDVPAMVSLAYTDDCGGPGSVAGTDGAPSGSCPATIIRTWTVTDPCMNASTVTQTITIDDTMPPVFSAPPGNVTVECAGDIPAMISLPYTDNCDAPGSVVGTDGPLMGTCPATMVRTWTFTDACGNIATVTQNIVIDDTTPPTLSAPPGAITVECAGDIPAMISLAYTDNCDAPGSVAGTDGSVMGSCPATVIRTWTVTDICGNPATVTQTITIDDTTPPMLSAPPGPITVECASDIPAMISLGYTDNCDAPGTVAGTDGPLMGSCPATVIRTWTVTDICGNPATVTQTITIDDTTPPVFTSPPGPITVECVGDIPAMISLAYTDNCDAPGSVAGTDGLVMGSCPATVVRTWTVTDICGNPATVTQTITIDDTTPPMFASPPGTITVECVGDIPAMISLGYTDNCDAPGSVAGTDGPVMGSCPATVIRTWTVTDICGNPSTVTQTITIDDTTPPALSAPPGPITVECIGDIPAMISLAYTDNCDAPGSVIGTDGPLTGTCPATVIRTWTFTDICGNPATVTQTITVDDTTPPVLSSPPGPITVDCIGDIPAMISLGYTDNCDAPGSVAGTNGPLMGTCPATLIRTWTITDICGNPATVTQTITVDDTTPPVLSSPPGPITVECVGDIPAMISLGYTDNCDAPGSVAGTDGPSMGTCPATVIRTWTVTDICGNPATVTQTITIDDTTPPVFASPPGSITVECTGDIPAMISLGYTDNCDAPGSVAGTDGPVMGSCPATVIRTWTVTDICGNPATVTQTITIDDTTPPVFTSPPGPITVECTGDIPAMISLAYTDNCDAPGNVAGTDGPVMGSCPATVIRTWTVTDICGNPATVTQTITIDDTTPPVFSSPPGPITVECAGDIPAMISLSYTDNCDAPGSVAGTDGPSMGTCPATVIRTWTVTDICGNPATVTQTITIDDTTPPVLSSPPGPITVDCIGDIPAMISLGYTDNCDAPGSVTGTDGPLMGTCPATVTRTWTITDICGNPATVTQTITIDDTTPPVLNSPPGPLTVDCIGDIPAMISLAYTDNCDAPGSVAGTDGPLMGTCPATVIRTWTVTDICGNPATVTQTITVDDTTPPVLSSPPGPITVECIGDIPAMISLGYTDNCDAPGSVAGTDGPSMGTCPATVIRTWTVTDICGNPATVTQTITIDDTTPPVFTAPPGPITVECVGDIPAMISLSYTDNCDAPGSVAGTDGPSMGTCPATVIRTWTVTDICGNPATVMQTITIDDTTPPVFTAPPGPITVECVGDIPAMISLSYTDNCDSPGSVAGTDGPSMGTCPATVIRTWTVTDICGNPATVTQTITIDDTTPPVFTSPPGPITVECVGDIPAMISLSYTDNCDAPGSVTGTDGPSMGTCPATVIRTWTVTDICGNPATVTQTITIDDTTPPVLSSPPGPITVDCIGDIPAMISLGYTDNCDLPGSVAGTDGPLMGTCPATVTRTWTVTDICGNPATVTQTITIDDTTPPVLNAPPGPITIECIGDIPAMISLGYTDNCDAPGSVAGTDGPLMGTCPATVIRTWTVTDICGNPATVTQTITVDDTTPPVLSAPPGPITIECIGDIPAMISLGYTDNCDAPGSVAGTDGPSMGTCPATVIRTWTVTDICGNPATVTQTITIDDTTPPVFTAPPGPITVECVGDIPAMISLAYTDNCDAPGSVAGTDGPSMGTCPATVIRTWTVTDICGNPATVTQTITIDDTTPPVFTSPPGPITVECVGDIPAMISLAYTDNCDAPGSVAGTDGPSMGTCPATVIRTWTVTDICGNPATVTQTITIDDTTSPVFTSPPGPITIECIGDIPAMISLAYTDNCDVPGSVAGTDGPLMGTCPATVTRTWTVTDICGNPATVTQTITIDDTTPPVLSSPPGPITIECIGDIPAMISLAYTDNCDAPGSVAGTDGPLMGTCPATVTRTWTITDICGNPATVTQTITIDDTTPPVLSPPPGPITIECIGDIPAMISLGYTDNCDAPGSVAGTDGPLMGTCPATVIRTWTVTDICGNPATVTQTITIDDTTPPVLNAPPGPITVECIGDIPAMISLGYTDNCDAPGSVAGTDGPSMGTCPATVIRTWTVTDICGNPATVTQTITIDDTTPPVFTSPPGPITIECVGDIPGMISLAYTDNCDAPGSIAGTDGPLMGTCPATVIRTWTVTDICGNPATVTQTITIDDTTPPVFTSPPGPITVECVGDIPAMISLAYTDNCDAPGSVAGTDGPSMGTCPATVIRTWTVTDVCGNPATVTQTITIDDTTPPVFTSPPGPITIECIGDIPAMISLAHTDNCDAPGSVPGTDGPLMGTCPATVIRTWTVTDICGNPATVTQTITIDDTTPPVFTSPPGPITIECIGDIPAMISLAYTDNCDAPGSVAGTDGPLMGTCPATMLRTWTVTDICGNPATVTQTITIDDDILPTASNPSTITADCIGDVPVPDVSVVTDAADNCPGAITVAFVNDVSDGSSCPETITRTYSVTDACGNQILVNQSIIVDDNVPPTASNPAPISVDCAAGVPVPDINLITDEADNCPLPVTVAFAGDVSDGGSCPETITRTYSVTDACGNQILVTQTITAGDIIPPTASNPAPVTVECIGDVPTPDPNTVTDEADNCGGAITVAFVDDVSGGGPCPEIITRTYSVTDACGNQILVTQTITVDDDINPTASSPAPITVDCVADVPAPDINLITDESDNCPGAITVAFVGDVSDGNTCPETITRTYSVTDACGNITLVTQSIIVDDDVLPTASNPSTMTADCIGDVPAPDVSVVTDAADNCPGTITVAFVNDVSDGSTCPETITRTYSVTDACGNQILVTQSIIVDDNVPPTASNPAPISVDCAAGVPVPDINLVTDEADNCPLPVTVAFVGDVSDGGSCPETITRTYSVTDACGNQILVTQTITAGDIIPPTASNPAPVTVECIGDVPTPDPNAVTDEADNCGGAITVAFVDDVSGGGPCPEIITRTYSVTDACGNQILVTQTITVDDDILPTASSPAPITVDCIADVPAPDVSLITDESDNCPGAITVAFVGDVSDGGTCPETITRTYSITDACGNVTLVTQSIIVDDDVLPTASNPSTLTADCIGDVPAPDVSVVTDAADNCPGTITVAFVNDVSDGSSCPETITRTYSVTDACGNQILVTQSIIVDDNVPPTASNPAPISVDCSAGVPVPDINLITDEADNCPLPITVAFVGDVSDGGSCPETITRTYSVTDACGNQILVTQTITAGDIIPPTASNPAPVTVECIGDVPTPDPNAVTDEADNCGGAITVAFVSDVSSGGPCPEIITRTYSVTDACGNQILVTQTITVDDDINPTASSPAPITVDCISDVPAPDVNLITDESDNCPGAITVAFVGDVSDGGTCPETITRTYSITDACGNVTLVTQSIIVDDDVLPTASNPSTITADCIGDVPAPDVSVVTDAADNCPGTITVAFVNDVSDGSSCPETITRTYSVTDACGNQILVTQSIIVDDNVPPTASDPAPLAVDCGAGVPVPDINQVTDEADNCPLPITVAFVSDVSDGGSCPETITRTYSVTDACGNQILVTQTITVGDVIPPTASDPAPVMVECVGDVPTPDPNAVTDEADNCGGAITVAFVSDVSSGGPCPEVITRTYSVTDACGNQILVTQTITINDTTDPTASSPAPVSVDCVADVPAPDINVITDEADNCVGAITVAFVGDVSDGGTCPETITRTYSVTDDCGNQLLVTQSIIVDDDILPTASNPSTLTAVCISDVPAPDISVVTDAADNCPGAITVTFVNDVSDGGSCPETITRTYSVTDACGNQILVTQSIIVDDDIPPTASNPASINVDCAGSVPAPDINEVIDEADNCPGAITVAFVGDATDGGSCPETITRTYSVTDACGNQILVTQSIVVGDIIPPTASDPAPLTFDCPEDVPAPDVNVVTDEADNCSGLLTVAFVSDVSSGGPCPEVITRTYSITDDCGNQILVTQSITINDITPPTASNPAPVTVDCIGDVPVADIGVVTDAADNCTAPVTIAFVSDVPDGGSCPLTITRTYSITDACGNQTLVTQPIMVEDDVLPTASNPSPIIISACNGPVPAPDISVVIDAADNCSLPVVAFVDDVADLVGCTETTTRTFSVTDACNNSITVTQLIIRTVDTTAPLFVNPPVDISVNCIGQVPPMVDLDYTDNCSTGGTVVGTESGPSGNPLTITRTWTVTDDCGNPATVTQTITITQSTTDVNITEDLCPGETVTINGVEYSVAGTYLDTLPGMGGECDTMLTIQINALPLNMLDISASYCYGDSVSVYGNWYNSPGVFFDTIPSTTGGCDTALTITITEDPLIQSTQSASYCYGDSVLLNGIWYSSPNTYFDTIPSTTGGCDTALTITITEDPLIQSAETASYCYGDSVLLNGIWYSTPNTYFDTIPSTTGGCDTALTITISEDPLIQSTQSASYCFRDSVLVNGEWYSTPGNYFDTIPSTTGGCDTALTLTITEDPLIQSSISASYCFGDSVLLNGIWYSSPNTYFDTIPSSTGSCDTALTITITENPLIQSTQTASYCSGDSVLLNGVWYNSPNTYFDTIPSTTGGCDTALTITITENPLLNDVIDASFCTGESVFVNGVEYDVAGVYQDTIMSTTGGCDTAVVINITEQGLILADVSASYCEGGSVFVYGTEYDVPGTYQDTVMSTTGGCDTAVTIMITEDPLLTNMIDANFCTGSSVFVYGVEYDVPGTYFDTIPSTTGGCDTAVTINISEQDLIPDMFNYSGCEGDGFSIIINGNEYNETNPDGTEIIPGQAGSCDTLLTIDLNFALNITAEIDPAGPLCTDAGTITLSAMPSDGTWSGAVTSDQFDPASLGTGVHEVIYTTEAGPCQTADTIYITVYELTLSCQTLQDVSTPGGNDGEGQVTVSGGVPPYDIDWTGPISGSVTIPADGDFVITDLTEGTYTIEVTDATGCTATCQFTIIDPVPCDLMIDGVTIQDATCPGVNNGSITVNASSTMPPVEYSIDNGAFGSNNVFSGLASGPHTIIVRDGAGCEVEQIINVGAGLGPNLFIVDTEDATCGLNNGSIEVDATGGSTPYTYSIDGVTYVLSGLFNGLGAGAYDIYLIDDGGCTDTITANVLASDAPVIDDYVIENSSCGQSDGSITINASGGIPPLMYSIGGPPQASNFFGGLPAGTYPVVVEDAAGCIVNGSATITDVGAPVITGIVTTPTSCGTFDGTITVNATGTPTLMYSLNGDPFVSTNIFTDLPSGTYTIRVRDGNGCITSEIVTVNTTNGPQITDVNVEPTTCGEDNGFIEIIASGGTGELSYCLDSDCDDFNEFPDLPAGVYDIIVEDENGCTAETQVTIDDSDGPSFDVYIDPAHCGQANGCIELDGMDGLPPYTYSMNGAAGPFGPVFTFCNKVSDFYLVAVKDANGCIHEEEVFLWEEAAPQIDEIIVTNPGCGETTGTIEIIADGVGDLMYSIQTPPVWQDANIFLNVLPGSYTVTVRDEWDCRDTGNAVITANPSPVLNVVVTDTECGLDEGIITASATIGLPPYEYSLNNGPFGPNNVFSGLAAGTYTVMVEGNNGCRDTMVVDIISVGTQFGDLALSICAGDSLFFEGDTFFIPDDYQIPIPGGATNGCDSILNLSLTLDPLIPATIQETICANQVYTYDGIDYDTPGTYFLDTISAATGCDTLLTLELSVDPLETTFLDMTICNGGVITINGIDYSVAGEYLIDTIPAAIGCDSARTLRLEVVDEIEVTIAGFICEGETYTINGMDYTMTGIYIVDTISGPNSCDTIVTLDLEVNPLPSANAGADMVLDCDVQSVTLDGSASGGSPLWTGPGINAGNETQLMPVVSVPGLYILTVTSGTNCVAIDSVVVDLDPESVVANAGPDDSLSCDVLEITLQGSPVGPDFTYQWTGPGINASNEHLPNPTIDVEGVYTLVVTNSVTGCISLPDTVVITDIAVILIAIIQDPIDFTCYVDTVDIAAVGSSTGPNIVYSWFDQEGNLIATTPGLMVSSGGMFTLIVEDTVSGCFGNDSVFVDDLTQYPQVDAGDPQVIDCNNSTVLLNEGAVNTNPNLVFNWDGPAGGIIGSDSAITAVAGIPGQYYYLYAMDTLIGCENYDSVFVADLTAPPVAEINIIENITCLDFSALLDIGASSVGPDFVYTWSGPGIQNIIANLIEPTLPGQLFLEVVNSLTGCSAMATVNLTIPSEPDGLLADILIPICEGDTSGQIMIQNVTGGTPGYMYSLDGGPLQNSPIFDGIMAGNYTIAVVDTNGCTYSETVTVADGISLSINIGPDIELELGDSSILWADVSLPWSLIDSIVWTPFDILSCTHCTTPTLYGLQDNVITATVYTSGCVDQDMLTLRVDVDAEIYIPNVFSPNDDGINDHVTVFTDHRVRKIVYLEIFDRWGNQVFVANNIEPNDPLLGWDGSFRGKKMNPAVFAYIARVELINGDTVDRKGDITIIR